MDLLNIAWGLQPAESRKNPRSNVYREHYKTKRRQAQGQKDLQDLLVDPLYDPLFQDMGKLQRFYMPPKCGPLNEQ